LFSIKLQFTILSHFAKIVKEPIFFFGFLPQGNKDKIPSTFSFDEGAGTIIAYSLAIQD